MQYEVRLRCVVEKTMICENCTEEEARENPLRYAVEEGIGETVDWEVHSVRKSE